MDDPTAHELRLIENIHREDLTDAEKGDAVIALQRRFPKKYPKYSDIAKVIGVSKNTVWGKWLPKSRKLSGKIKSLTLKGDISELHTVSLLKYDHETQNRLADAIVENKVPSGEPLSRFLRAFDEDPTRDLDGLADFIIDVHHGTFTLTR